MCFIWLFVLTFQAFHKGEVVECEPQCNISLIFEVKGP